jgi:hypothetical protein
MRTVIFSAFLTCILLTSVADALDDWTQQYPVSKPSARYQHAMAYIGGDQVLLFGGYKSGSDHDDETWMYDLSDNTWIQQIPSTKPLGRMFHAMAYIGDDKVLLFGGWDGDSSYADTWVYDLSDHNWTQQSDSVGPSARYLHAMAYIGEDQVLLFGGQDAGGYDDETWIFDLSDTAWTQLSPVSKPSARHLHGMVYIGGDQVLLFGGADAIVGYTNDTWVYDLSSDNWYQQSPSTKPSERGYHGMAYMGGDQVLVFGGANPALNDETWIYDISDTVWIQDSNTTQPSARWGLRLSETSMDGSSYLVLFGGFDDNLDDETWTFGGGDYPLPVELSSFTATGSQEIVTLKWTTESEWNNQGFHIYRRQGISKDFERITQELIAGAGNSSTPQRYIWQDQQVENGQVYWYLLESLDFQGETRRYGPVSTMLLDALPLTCQLFQNYPNPFNPETWISYQLPQAGPVTIKIYNISGQLVDTLVDGEHAPGTYRVHWDGRNFHGIPAASGIYFCQMKTPQLVQTTKMILLR